MGNHLAYTISGPLPDPIDLPLRLSKSPSVRREPKLSGNNLRILYQNPVALSDHHTSLSSPNNETLSTATPVLPPTPPNIEEENNGNELDESSTTEAVKVRSVLATPVNQISPPTPDNTPPREKSRLRPFLGAQPSMTSTRAESFRTAQEELLSDRESESSQPAWSPDQNRSLSFLPMHLTNGTHKPSPLANLPITNGDLTSKDSTPKLASSPIVPSLEDSRNQTISHSQSLPQEDALTEPIANGAIIGSSNIVRDDVQPKIRSRKEGVERGRSLRERLEDSRQVQHSPSIDKFASIIGWSHSVEHSIGDDRRWSGVSATSTVEAFLVEPPQVPKKRNTLRHMSKKDSLRAASSPLPTSNRTSMQSSSDSPHRLVHKKAKLSNQNRLSFGSEVSRSVSVGSNVVPKFEVIRVAVIPQRSSSLQQSMSNSRRHSHSTTGGPTSFRMPRTSENFQRQQATTDMVDRDRDRDRYYPPQVPTRGSSLSAPTSRNTSRANSITSEHVYSERKKAEKDLRVTLDRMELERIAGSSKSASVDTTLLPETTDDVRPSQNPHSDFETHRSKIRAHGTATGGDRSLEHTTPGTKEWAELRPPSTLHTPFSQPSFMSASPEISEAKMISLHVHNNHSVQLIEPFPLQESDAVEEARRLNQNNALEYETLDSPLRNPRKPPIPPQFHFVPATPQDEIQPPLELAVDHNSVPSTPRRPAVRTRTDSFGKTLLRAVSLKNPRNKKADQDLDSSLNPFWRPRPFWDGIEGASPEKKRDLVTEEHGVINNSLGMPQQRLVVAGPLELVRKFSERRRNRKVIARQSSYNSLQRLRTGHRLYRLPGFGIHIHSMSLKNMQDKVIEARQRKEEKKREKRREALRRSIGANVVATGDSRFPATSLGEDSPN